MKQEIITNISNPKQLEKLYRENRSAFKREFNQIYPTIQDSAIAQIWNTRLNFEEEKISWGTNKELFFVIISAFISALIAKLPDITGIDSEYFYSRNIGFIVFPLLSAYFAWKQKLQMKQILAVFVVFVISAIHINNLPNNIESDTLVLACVHMPLFLWSVFGFTFVGNLSDKHKRLDFLRYNGDLVVMTAIILIAGGLLTGITIGLFSLIKINIEDFYFKYIVISGLAAVPIVGSYLVQTNPHLVNKVSPVIARVFSPLVLITLVVYLIAIIYSGKDPYNDRDFLLIFNVLLIGVMALILFSIAETSKNSDSKTGLLILLGLSIVTIVINGIALSAILFRISEWGITPNRLAVLGGNILILSNLLVVTFRLFRTMKDRNEITKVEESIAFFLPFYKN
ncbi:MAG: hypothetical protein K0S44_2062 [Bacteroidetes bacterium]|nr:hypothetical protein [Bacteroidota bacterium]